MFSGVLVESRVWYEAVTVSRVLGIDRRDDAFVLAQVRVAHRKVHIEHLVEESFSDEADAERALRALGERVGGVRGHGVDALVTAVEGARTIVSTVSIPASAEKRFDELLPFELEAELPMELDEVTYNHQFFPRKRGSNEPVRALVVAAPKDLVRAEIERYGRTLEREPDAIASTALVLSQLVFVSEPLRVAERAVIVDIGGKRSDVCVLERGVVRGIRSLSRGVSSFPERAEQFVAELRQSLAALDALEGATLHLVGEGALLEGLSAFLADRTGLPAAALVDLSLEGLPEDKQRELPRYGRAIALGVHAALGKGLDLRQGEFAQRRGYSYLKEKAPILLGLTALVLVSFVFATWAESRAVDKQTAMLEASLAALTKKTFNQETSSLEEAQALLDGERKGRPEDPMPYLDGFGAMVALSEVMPPDIKHDVEQLELAKGKLKLRAVVDSTEEAEQIQKALEEHRCIEKVTIAKMTQVVNTQRTRYHLEADVRCPEETPPEKKKPAASAAADQESAE